MSISFNSIPINIRTPGTFLEVDNSRALSGLSNIDQKMLMIGQRLATGETAAEVLTLVVSAEDADRQFGLGSMLARMCKAAIANNGYTEMWAIALDDAAAGVAATGTLVVTGPATKQGTLNLYIGGERVRISVTAGDAASDVATALAAAINADTELPVTAAAVDGAITLTARHKGAVGNYIDLRLNYQTDEKTPTGIAVAITAMADGDGNPEVADAIAVLPDEQFHYIAMPYTDATNLSDMEDELDDRWGPMQQMAGHCFCVALGTTAALNTLGATRNNSHVTILGAGKSPTAVDVWVGALVGVAAYYYNIDPARPLQTLVLSEVLAPALADRFSQSERNVLLHGGVSTFIVDDGGDCMIERLITTYQTNALGVDDPSYLDVNTIMTLIYIRSQVRTRLTNAYPRHKLADDDARVGAGQAVVRPKDLRVEIIALFEEMETAGIVENLDQFKADLLVERDGSDKNRVNALMPPDLVGQFRVFAGQVQFIL